MKREALEWHVSGPEFHSPLPQKTVLKNWEEIPEAETIENNEWWVGFLKKENKNYHCCFIPVTNLTTSSKPHLSLSLCTHLQNDSYYSGLRRLNRCVCDKYSDLLCGGHWGLVVKGHSPLPSRCWISGESAVRNWTQIPTTFQVHYWKYAAPCSLLVYIYIIFIFMSHWNLKFIEAGLLWNSSF